MKKLLLVLFCFISISLVSNAQWAQQASGFNRNGTYPYDLDAVDSNVVWLIGNAGDGTGVSIQEYSRTIDGGNLFVAGTVTADTNYNFSNITAFNGDLAWATMYNNVPAAGGKVFRTTDGGTTWTALSPGTIFVTASVSFPNLTHFWNAETGFSMGDPVGGFFEIYTTVDSGNTWTRVPSTSIPAPLSGEFGLVDLYSVVDSTIWFGTNKGRVFKSSDLGHTWTAASVGNADAISEVTFRDLNNGVCLKFNATTLWALHGTNDGGTTWLPVSPVGLWFKSDLEYVPGTSTLLSVGASTLYGRGSTYSLDDGLSWTAIDSGSTSIGQDGYTSVSFVNATTGWAGGFTTNAITGGVSRWLGGPVATQQAPVENHSLFVYPNPSRSFVRLTMNLDKRAEVKIRVSNMLGQVVFTTSEQVLSGQLNHLIQVENWKSGVYFATIEWNGNKVQQKIVIQ